MYGKYAWVAGATKANVLADLVALLTSAAPVISGLSAGCDKPLTEISVNTVNSNWVVFDAAAAADTVCLRSLNADGVTYKYITLNVTATLIGIKAYESWNAATHVGLNLASYGTTAIPVILTNSGYVQFSVTDRYIGIIRNPLLGSENNFVFEFSRGSKAIDATYPCIIVTDAQTIFSSNSNQVGNSNAGLCRVKDPRTATGDLTGSISSTVNSMVPLLSGGSIAGGQSGGAYGVDGVKRLLILPFHLMYNAFNNGVVGYLGQILGNVMQLPASGLTFANCDELTIDAETYVALYNYQTAILIPKV